MGKCILNRHFPLRFVQLLLFSLRLQYSSPFNLKIGINRDLKSEKFRSEPHECVGLIGKHEQKCSISGQQSLYSDSVLMAHERGFKVSYRGTLDTVNYVCVEKIPKPTEAQIVSSYVIIVTLQIRKLARVLF